MQVTDKIDEAKLKIAKFLNDNQMSYSYVDTIVNHRNKDSFYVIAIFEVMYPSVMKKLAEHEDFMSVLPYTNKHIIAKFLIS